MSTIDPYLLDPPEDDLCSLCVIQNGRIDVGIATPLQPLRRVTQPPSSVVPSRGASTGWHAATAKLGMQATSSPYARRPVGHR